MVEDSSSPHRYVSFTFHDGLVCSSRKVTHILGEYAAKASFYVVTGWIRPNRMWVRDPWNRGLDHGTWQDWQEISETGHEVGSHTRSHLNLGGKLARLVPFLVQREVLGSYQDLKRQLRHLPISIAFPWNAATIHTQRLVAQVYCAAEMGTNQLVPYNDVANINWYQLRSWAPDSTTRLEEFFQIINKLPPNHWLIFQFHGLDDEGWNPIATSNFEALLRFLIGKSDVQLVTIRQMVRRFSGIE